MTLLKGVRRAENSVEIWYKTNENFQKDYIYRLFGLSKCQSL